jgi:hypothetical protein
MWIHFQFCTLLQFQNVQFLALKESYLAELYASFAWIFFDKNKFHLCCIPSLIKVFSPCIPAFSFPFRVCESYILPVIPVFFLIGFTVDRHLVWIPFYAVISRLERDTSNALFLPCWESYYNPWLIAVAKPFVPRLLSWQKEILTDFSTLFMAMFSFNWSTSLILITIWIEQEFDTLFNFFYDLFLFCSKKSYLTKLYAPVIRIHKDESESGCCSRFLESTVDCLPPTLIPLRCKVFDILPILTVIRLNLDRFWVSIYTIICRFECDPSYWVLFALWEGNFYPWLIAVTKPFVPRLLSW